jgi:hypothetical protein
MLFQYDQDKNIVAKNTYLMPNDIGAFSPYFSYSPNTSITSATSLSFIGASGFGCGTSGNTYSWNFGDGTTTSPSTSNTATHTYSTTITSNTNYTATLTVTSPFLSTKTYSQTITVAPPPPPVVTISADSFTLAYGDISSVGFYQSGSLVYSFTGDPTGQTIPQGVYDVHVHLSGGQLYDSGTGDGYSCVVLQGTTCQGFVSSNNYTFSGVNLSSSTSLYIMISQFTCSELGL